MIIRSIYVAPEFRRLGVGTELFEELSPDQENMILDWFEEEFGENGLDQDTYDSSSIFYIEKEEVRGAVFIRQDSPSDYDIVVNGPDSPPDDLLDIDYIFCPSSDKKALPGMMNKLIKRLSKEHKDTSRIQGFIMNDDGLELYKSLFGVPEIEIPIFVSAET